MPLHEQTRVVASPVATSPARTLIEELDVVLKSSLNLALRIVLDPGLPSFGNQPAGNKVVIVSIELILAPTLSFEAIQEQGALKNLRAERTGAAGHAGGPTIDSMCRRDFEVASLNVGSPEPIETKCIKRSRANSLDSLVGSNSANLRIFERSEQPGQNCAWPRDIVVCHDDDGSLDLGDRLADLNSLICNRHVECADIRRLQ